MIFEYNSAQGFLATELQNRVKHNQRYSLRSFARQLGLSPGELSEILSGKRQLSFKSALRISKALGLTALESQHLIQLASSSQTAKHDLTIAMPLKEIYQKRRVLEEQTFQLLSDWYYFAVINLMDCKGFQWNPLWISRRLGITRTQARLAMDLLLQVGLVKEYKGVYKVDSDFVLSQDGIPSQAIRSYHRQILEKALLALQEQRPEERDITGIGFALDPKHLPSIKREIAEFQEKLCAKYSKGSRNHVYQFETIFIRLTEGDSNEI